MSKIKTAIVVTFIGYTWNTSCMELVQINNPRNTIHLLQNKAQYLEQLRQIEDTGIYCPDLCIAHKTLKALFDFKREHKDARSFPQTYYADEEELKKIFGSNAIHNAKQFLRITKTSKSLLNSFTHCNDAQQAEDLNEQVKKVLSEMFTTGAYVRRHFPHLHGQTLLHYAASKSVLTEVLKTLLAVTQPDLLDEYGRSPMFYAVSNGAYDNMETLLAHKASYNLKDCNSSTPLHYAVLKNTRYCHRLCYKGANLNAQDNWGCTPLHVALDNNVASEIVEFLLSLESLDFNKRTAIGDSYVDRALKSYSLENARMVKETIDGELLYFFRNHYPIAHTDFCDKIAEFVALGANVNARYNSYDQSPYYYGKTVLYQAINHGCEKCVRLLIKHKAPLNMPACTGRFLSYLDLAVDNKFYSAIGILIDSGVCVDEKDHNGHTRLFCAAFRGESEVVKVLLDYGALVNGHMIQKFSDDIFDKSVFELLHNAYAQQECCICFATQQEVERENCSLIRVPCMLNHRRNFMCESCYNGIKVIDGKKSCPFACPEGLKKYPDFK